jgi:hypothetical protein
MGLWDHPRMSMPTLLRQRRTQIIAAAAVVMLVVVWAATRGSDEHRLVTLDDTTSTSATSTTAELPATIEPTTPSTTATTSAPATDTTAVPPVVTRPPTTAPPTTSSAGGGSLDLMAVATFAKANRPDTPVPYMYSGSTCEVGTERMSDEGDDAEGDLGMVELARDCSGTFRLFPGAGDAPFGAYWVEIDAGPGGCGGVDVVAAIWPGGSSTLGAVVTTAGCAQDSWAAIDTTGNPAYPNKLLDFRGSTFGDPAGFRWRAGMLGAGGDTTIDRAPNSGFAIFQR